MPENINEQLNIADAKGGKNNEGGENSRPKFDISADNPELSKTTSQLNDLHSMVAGDKQIDAETLNKIREQILALKNKEKEKHSISVNYTHPDGKQETINLDLETKLVDFFSFYQETNIDLPPDFANTIRDIWKKNQTEIERAIEQNGFDDMLIIPPTTDIGDLSKKMRMSKNYHDLINPRGLAVSWPETLADIPFVSQNTDKPRLILVHKTQNFKDRPELQQTIDTKAEDVKMDQALTLEDYLIFQRKYFEETGKHLEDDVIKGSVVSTWLATKSGDGVVYSGWRPDYHQLSVHVHSLGSRFQSPSNGVRPARSFF